MMRKDFSLVPLRDIALPVERPEIPILGKKYRQIGVKLWGEGGYERESIDGSQTQYKTLSRVEADDIIVNKIWARNGSVSVVSSTLAGCYASGEFPTFAPIREYLEPRWFYWLTKTKYFWEQCDEKSRGTSGKNRIRPERFLEIKIPLPPLEEQRRIVARLEELVGKFEEVRSLRQKALEESEALTKAAMRQIFKPHENYQEVSLESVCAAIIDNLHSNPVYSDNGVPCIRSSDVGWGALYLHTARCTSEEEYKRRTVRGEPIPNDIVLVREGGGTGKAAIVLEGQRFSLGQRLMMLRPDKNKVRPKFFLYQILSPSVYEDQIIPRCKGSASPHLNIGALRKFNFFLPPLPKQHRIVNYLDELQTKVDTIKRQREKAMKELDALLPSILDKAFKGKL
ncbi:restriction endonuclease subunit S [Nostoc sp.]|uniref:restriction endonuclease subunit S n=1 Tax=Nostoc sp. TaxID=1180 RepID=UPI002FF07301